ncbi:SMP-30/gluconolactonase/LRE family protein [Cytophagaceae bacterium YF14B1]|uniref:SMP-30/gluconolactonase/LRE family protein n=1 Tax=Xanthocytophaga flava TaxID=3048013 RepID=A0AAE3UA40_9BACT|nr:SMP-30/gluconolactonase/LRE family protein [Xanthocytophaga flavus]MDJ1485116.1 SMP-30/gluconolactonase/LRE family protein [Xanthocytophaga flavus]
MTNLFTTSLFALCIALGLPFVQSSLSENVANHNFRQTVQTIADSTSGSGIIAPQAKPQLVSSQFSFTEGPAVDKKGNVYFTDQPNNKIWKYDIEGKLSVFMENSGRSNGMYFDQKGNLISCADENNQLWSISPQGKVTVLLKDFQGHTFNGPNDVWVDKSGGIYFTDPYYQRPYWKRQSPDPNLGGEKLYYLPKGASAAILLDDTFKQPNGLIGTPDGKILYVADIGDNKTYKYEIAGNGVLKNRQLFVNQGSDGMTIDNQGNVYLTGNGVTIYNKEGQKIEHIPIQAKWTANVCFGGKEKNLLFITASESVYTLKMQVKGVQ